MSRKAREPVFCIPIAISALECHRNFGPGKNGPRTKFFIENFGPPGPLFPKKLVQIENLGPGVAVQHRASPLSLPRPP